MKKIDRSTVSPKCLSKYKHGEDNWDSVTSTDKEFIRKELNGLQNSRCAYCELKFSEENLFQIEHFNRRNDYPKEIFDWNNLFNSCKSTDTCGHFKDGPKNKFRDLKIIKPDVENPCQYLKCEISGKLTTRRDSMCQALSSNTINRLNLNHEKLIGQRKEFIRSLLNALNEIELANFSISEKDELMIELKNEHINGSFNLVLNSIV